MSYEVVAMKDLAAKLRSGPRRVALGLDEGQLKAFGVDATPGKIPKGTPSIVIGPIPGPFPNVVMPDCSSMRSKTPCYPAFQMNSRGQVRWACSCGLPSGDERKKTPEPKPIPLGGECEIVLVQRGRGYRVACDKTNCPDCTLTMEIDPTGMMRFACVCPVQLVIPPRSIADPSRPRHKKPGGIVPEPTGRRRRRPR